MLKRIPKLNYEKIKDSTNKVIIYGAGDYGRKVYGFLNQMNINIYAFCDTNKKGFIDEHVILAPDQLMRGESYLILVAIYSEGFKREVLQLLDQKDLNGYVFVGDVLADSDISLFFDRRQKRFIINNRYKFYCDIPWYFHMAYDKYPSSEYIKGVFIGYPHIYLKNNYYVGADFRSKYVNISGGKRRTTDIPQHCENKIIFFGDSRVSGYGLEDAQTIPSVLQRMLNERWPDRYCCENYSFGAYSFSVIYNLIKDIQISKGDIILCQLTALRGYDANVAIPDGMLQWYVKEIADYCNKKGASLIYVNFGQNQPVQCVGNKSMAEEFICRVFENSTSKRRFMDQHCRRFEDIVYWEDFCRKAGAGFINAMDALAKLPEHEDCCYFLDEVHPGSYGAMLLAQDIFAALSEQNIIREEYNYREMHKAVGKGDLVYIYPFCREDAFQEYMEYLKVISDNGPDNCGAIVMNANPFTKGHRYLVEKAVNQVERLYVFVLEENRSDFSFEERLEMVKRGVRDLSEKGEIIVLRSGSFIISERTFPEYFADTDNKCPDCSKDLGIFGYFIAPALRIRKRFVGTEPYSDVTKAYNEQMKNLLPLYNIELIEIERMAIGQEVVSATKIRRALKNKNLELLQSLLPDTSYEYLMEHGYFT